MSNGVNNTVGDVSLKMGVDASTVAAEAKAAAEKANAAAEEMLVKQVNARDAALRANHQKLKASWERERAEFRSHLERMAQDRSEVESRSFGSGPTKAAQGLEEQLKRNRQQFTGLFEQLSKWTIIGGIILGVAEAFKTLGTYIGEFVFGPLQSASDKAQEFRNALDDKPRERLAQLTKEMERLNKMSDGSTAGLIEMAHEFKGGTGFDEYYKQIEASIKTTREAADNQLKEAQANAERLADIEKQRLANEYIERQNARRDASAEYNAAVEDAIAKQELEQESFSREMKDFYASMTEEAEKSARKTQQAFEASFRAIREASNAAFNTDQARSMVELAGNLNQTATTATANMNRIIVGGTD